MRNGKADSKRTWAVALSLSLTLSSSLFLSCPEAQAVSSGKGSSKSSPGGTLLLPLTPKIDQHEDLAPSGGSGQGSSSGSSSDSSSGFSSDSSPSASKADQPKSAAVGSPLDSSGSASSRSDQLMPEKPQEDTPNLSDAPTKLSPEADSSTTLEATASADDLQMSEMDSVVSEDSTLKGTIQIVADDTEYDQEKNTFLGTGNAVAIIGGQNSKLEADLILYDQNSGIIDARGNVKILRQGQLTTGSAFKFKVSSDEYLITNPDTELNGTQVVSRRAYGTSKGLLFTNGTMTGTKPFHFGKNMMYGPQSASQDISDKLNHPDAFLQDKASFKFTARKMVYEKYLNQGNLTVFGGRLNFDNFSVPVPKFVATIGQENNIMFPISPMLSSNIQSGGINVGPSFNSPMGRFGKFNWAPMIQFGGRPAGTTGGSSIGLSGQVGYSDKKISTHLAYGSVSNLLIADFRTKLTKQTTIQAGINRYLNDGIFGYRRARAIVEVVHTKQFSTIPYLSNLSFRSSAGLAQDNPQLINTNSAYAALYGGPTSNTVKRAGARLQEQITATTQPLFSVGNDRYGAKGYIFGGLGASAYSTGNFRTMAQIGPSMQIKAGRANFNVNYTQSAVRGSSPFLFDQFLQGNKSANISGDFKVNKWLTVGGGYGYNLDSKLPYMKTISAAIGPQDFKLLLSRNMIQGINRFGFDIMYGDPVPFKKLAIKGQGDAGQLGGLQ